MSTNEDEEVWNVFSDVNSLLADLVEKLRTTSFDSIQRHGFAEEIFLESTDDTSFPVTWRCRLGFHLPRVLHGMIKDRCWSLRRHNLDKIPRQPFLFQDFLQSPVYDL